MNISCFGAAPSGAAPDVFPGLSCARREWQPGAEPGADAEGEFWRGIEPAPMKEAVTGNPPAQATTVHLAWSAEFFHVLFEVSDTEVWATLTERDASLYSEEVVELFLDPVGDQESYFEIELNPLNTVMDLVLRRNRSGYRRDFSWNCEGLRTATRRTSSGWVGEFLIPFSSLMAEPPHEGSRWRANFCRIDRPTGRPRELSAWSPVFRGTFHTPERFGMVEFRSGDGGLGA